jgi:hypothetical protein
MHFGLDDARLAVPRRRATGHRTLLLSGKTVREHLVLLRYVGPGQTLPLRLAACQNGPVQVHCAIDDAVQATRDTSDAVRLSLNGRTIRGTLWPLVFSLHSFWLPISG